MKIMPSAERGTHLHRRPENQTQVREKRIGVERKEKKKRTNALTKFLLPLRLRPIQSQDCALYSYSRKKNLFRILSQFATFFGVTKFGQTVRLRLCLCFALPSSTVTCPQPQPAPVGERTTEGPRLCCAYFGDQATSSIWLCVCV